MVHILTEVRRTGLAGTSHDLYINLFGKALCGISPRSNRLCINFKVNCDFLLYVSATSYFVVNKGGSIFLLINNFQ